MRKTDVKHRARAYICALDKKICKLEKTGNWDAKLLERIFPHFAKKIWMKVICQTLGDAFIMSAMQW